MPWSAYGSFLVFAVTLVLIPGPDFAVVTKNALAAGRRRGAWCAAGVASSNTVQGIAAAAGLGTVIARAQPVFTVVKWAGAGYLLYLGVQAVRSAIQGRYELPDGGPPAGIAFGGWRQGFLSNITNPKVLVFYLAVLPQFLDSNAGVGVLLVFALSHAALSLLYLSALVLSLHQARQLLSRRRVRRWLDCVTGAALLGFGARLAIDHT